MGIFKSLKLSGLILVLIAVTMTGCARPQSDAKVAVIADYAVILDTPLVKIDKSGVTNISGSVHRQPTVTGPITGRIDVDFISPDGDIINDDPLTIGLIPPKIPTDPKAVSTYSIPWCYVPPPGTTVRVQFVDTQTAANEDAGGRSQSGGAAAGGGGHHGGGGGIRTGSTGHNW